MFAVLGFVITLAVITGLIHLYLWKRLVKDTTTAGRWRRAGTVTAVVLALLVPATMVGTRAGMYWLAWPGYLWLALMFYLLVLLVVLEVPMVVARLVLRRRSVLVAPEPVLVGPAAAPVPGSSTDEPADDEPAAPGAPAQPTADGPCCSPGVPRSSPDSPPPAWSATAYAPRWVRPGWTGCRSGWPSCPAAWTACASPPSRTSTSAR